MLFFHKIWLGLISDFSMHRLCLLIWLSSNVKNIVHLSPLPLNESLKLNQRSCSAKLALKFCIPIHAAHNSALFHFQGKYTFSSQPPMILSVILKGPINHFELLLGSKMSCITKLLEHCWNVNRSKTEIIVHAF